VSPAETEAQILASVLAEIRELAAGKSITSIAPDLGVGILTTPEVGDLGAGILGTPEAPDLGVGHAATLQACPRRPAPDRQAYGRKPRMSANGHR
jgi:hypothetical protein